jgi:hypothetical protein
MIVWMENLTPAARKCKTTLSWRDFIAVNGGHAENRVISQTASNLPESSLYVDRWRAFPITALS